MGETVVIGLEIDNNDAIKATKSLTESIVDQTDAIKDTNEETKKLEKQNKDLQKQNKEINDQVKKGTIDREKGAKQLETNNRVIEKNTAVIKQNKVQVIGQKDDLKKTNAELNTARKNQDLVSNSLESVTAENKKLRAEQGKLNLETEEGTVRNKEINESINKNTDFIKENSDELVQQKLNIGNYSSSLDGLGGILSQSGGAFGGLSERIKTASIGFKTAKDSADGIKNAVGQFKAIFSTASSSTEALNKNTIGFNKSLDTTSTTGKKIPGVLGGVSKGIKGVTKSALAFIATPLGIILAAIAIVISLVGAALSKMQPVMDKISQVGAGLSAVFDALLAIFGKLAILVKESVINVFLKLQAAILKTQIAINKFLGNTEKVIELQEELNKVNEEIAESNKKVADSFDKVSDSIKNVGEAFNEAALIEKLQQLTNRFEIATIVTNASLRSQSEQLARTADDATKSFNERTNAALKLGRVNQALADNELKLAKDLETIEARKLAQAKKNGFATDEIKRSAAEATAKRIEKEAEIENIAFENDRRLSELKQDILERDLDFEIDIIDKRLQAIRGASDDETVDLDTRISNLKDFQEQFAESSKRQIGILQEFTDKKIDLDALLEESDISVLTQKVRSFGLSEIIEGRLLEVLRDRTDALFDLNEKEVQLNVKKENQDKKALDLVKQTTKLEAKTRGDSQLDILKGTEFFFKKREELALANFDSTSKKLEDQLASKEITQEEFNLKSLENQIKFNDETADIDKEFREFKNQVDEEDFAARRELEDEIFQEELETLKTALGNELLTEQEHKAALKKLEQDHTDTILKINKDKQDQLFKNLELAIGATQAITNAAFSIAASNLEAEQRRESDSFNTQNQNLLDNLQARLDSGLISQEDFEKEKENLDNKALEFQKKQAKEQHALDVKAFNAKKALDLVEIGIQIFKTISTAITASPLTFGLPWSAVNLAVQTAQAIGIAASNPPPAPSFAEGGAVIKGKSHAQGGEDIHVGGKLIGNMQGDEGLFVTKRQATADALSYINQSYGGKSFSGRVHNSFFQEGGTGVPISQGIDREELLSILNELPPPVVKVVDVQAGLVSREETLEVTVV